MLYNKQQVSGIYSVIISSVYIVLNSNIIFQWYNNADLKTCQYLHLHMKITFRRFHRKHLLRFEIDARDICGVFVYKHSETKLYVKNWPAF